MFIVLYKLRVLLLLCLFITTSSLMAQTVSGGGVRLCGEYVGYMNMGDEVGVDSFVSWAHGFISAWNWANPSGKEVQIDTSSLTWWLHNYCSSEPDQRLYRAMQLFVQQHAR